MIYHSKKRYPIYFLILGMVALLFCGCTKKKTKEYHGDYIFYPNANENKVGFEKYSSPAKDCNDQVRDYLKQLQSEPKNLSLKRAIPEEILVDDFNIDAQKHLTLFFSSGYGKLKGVSEILRRAAIVKTLCQIKDIDAIQFYVAGQPLTDSNMNAVGYMTEDSFIDNTGGETTYKQNTTLNVYFADYTGEKLFRVPVDITYDATIPLEQLAIEQLIKGPYSIQGVSKKEIVPTIPKGTKLNKISVKENICYVDFSADFLEKRADVSAEATLYSVINTLTDLSNINKVQFSINGEQVLYYNDTIDFGSQFGRNLDIVKNENN